MSKKILLVEDKAIIAMSTAKMLEKHNYKVVTAYKGEKAVKMVKEDPVISLILMDIDLGSGIDGTEAAREILRINDIPIVFLTSHSEKEYVNKVKEITNYGYVLKNSGEFVLIEAIRMAYQLFDSWEKLKEKEEQLNLAMDAEDHGYWDWNLDTNEAYFSPRYCQMLGYEPDELPKHYRTWVKLLHIEDREYAIDTVKEKLKQVEPFELEFRLQTKRGEWKWIKGKGNSYHIDHKGTPHRVVGTHEDITERKKAEIELKENEEHLRTTLNSIGDAVISTDLNGNVMRMNPVAERLTGWTVETAKGKQLNEVFHIIHADTREVVANPVEEVLQQGEIVSLRNHTILISKDGREYQIADSASPINGDEGNINGVVLVFRDVTEQYEKDRQINESKKKYRGLFNSIRDAILVTDTDRNIIDCNPAFTDLFGYILDEIRGLKPLIIYQSEKEYSQIGKTLREPKCYLTNSILTIQYKRKDGTTFPGEANVFYLRGDSDEINGTAGLIRDITERKRVEEVLRKSKDLLNASQHLSKTGGWEWNLETQTMYWTEETYRIHDFAMDEMKPGTSEHINRSIECYNPEDRQTIMTAFQHCLDEGEPYDLEFPFTTAKGRRLWIRTIAHPIFERGKVIRVIGNIMDITERKQNEEKLQKALEEKDFLMQELNHRVKNNLVMVNSLISLKASVLGDSIDLSDLSNQIETIRIVHEKLYQTDDISHINIRDYFKELLENIFSSFSPTPVTIHQKFGEILLEAKRAIPIGLIINEIATNAVKYGFNHEEEAVFSVKMDLDKKKNVYTLIVSNTGNSFPEDINIDNPNTLGLRLITALVEQLEGNIELKKKPYPIFTISFPVGEE